MSTCPEPPLSPPDPCDGPEPTDSEWLEWRLQELDCLMEDDKLVEACDTALQEIGQAMIDNKDIDYEKIGKALFGAVEVYVGEGDFSDFEQDAKDKAAEDFVEPAPPDDDDYPEFYDGTGRY